MTDGNIKSTLYLKNLLDISPLEVTPILYLANGTRISLAPVKLAAAGTATVSINRALEQHDIAPYSQLSGYVEAQYRWPWAALSATVSNADTAHSLLFNYNLGLVLPDWDADDVSSRAVTPDTGEPSRLKKIEGMWWKETKDVKGFVSFSNPTLNSVEVTVVVNDDSTKVIGKHTVTVASHETKTFDLPELSNVLTSAGGLSVSYDGPLAGLLVRGGLADSDAGYSANIPFLNDSSDPSTKTLTKQAATLSVAELGLLVGAADPMMLFPSTTVFTPYSAMRNTSDEPVLVGQILYWMDGGQPRSAQLPNFTLSPHQTTTLDLLSLMTRAGLRNFNGSVSLIFEIPTKSIPAMLLVSGSVDKKKTYVFGVVPNVVTESEGLTLSYWSTGNNDDTMVTVWNPADEEQDFLFTLVYSGGHYRMPLHLGPRHTRAFNISEIIHNQLPDAEGNIVPVSIHEGSAQLTGAHSEAETILVAMGRFYLQRSEGHVHSLAVGLSRFRQYIRCL